MLNINYFVLEPGIEPGATRWQRIIFPLNYTSIKYKIIFYAYIFLTSQYRDSNPNYEEEY